MTYKLLAVALLAIALGGCASQVGGTLPAVPADIQACFRHGAVIVPARALSVAEVESLWKKDRVRLAVERSCGRRFLAWYGDLQKRWQ